MLTIDVRKVSNKINQNNLKINIKRNKTIWSIFNEEDEKKLINIPTNFLAPIPEEDNQYFTDYKSIYSKNNNNIQKYPQDNLKLKNNNILYNNNNVYQGYGVGPEGIDSYDVTYTSGTFQTNQKQNQYVDLLSGPIINVIDPETNNDIIFRGEKKGPVFELPSFGVPSPEEENKIEEAYNFSSGIFQPNFS